jgi:hypothetical protein
MKITQYFIITFILLSIFPYEKTHATELEEIVPCRQKTTESTAKDEDWMQIMHSSVSDSVYQSAYWFDSFFSDDDSEQISPQTNARIQLGWEPKSRHLGKVDARFRIKVRLPHFKNKVDLIFSDDRDDELSQLPLETVRTKPTLNDEKFAAAVRFIYSQDTDKLTDSRIGISGGDLFVRARHKRRFAWDDKHGFKFEPAVHYFVDDGLGARVLMEYNYQLEAHKQLRVNYSVNASEAYSGLRWKHGFYYLKQTANHRASFWGLQIEGKRNSEEGFSVDKYTLSYRLRFNAIKKWLFFEVEPFVEWPKEEDYKTTPGIALRVEGYFFKG